MMWLHFALIALILYLALIIIILNNNKSRDNFNDTVYLIVTFIILFVISGFRSVSVGNDTITYYNYFLRTLNEAPSIFDYSGRLEFGYFIFNKLLCSISENPQILLIISSFITLALYFIFIKRNSPIIWLSVYLLVTNIIFYSTMTRLRQSIAIGIVMISYEFVKDKKPFHFVFTTIAAAFFHVSALVFLIVYPFRNIKFTKERVVVLTIGAVIIFLSYDIFAGIIANMPIRYANYIYADKFTDVKVGSIINFLVFLVILLFGVILGVYKKPNNKQRIIVSRGDNINYENSNNLLTYICLFGVLTSFIAINFHLLSRIAVYFTIFNIIYIPTIIKSIKNKNLAVLNIYLVIVLFLLYSSAILYFRPEWHGVLPYSFFWQHN